MAPGDENERKKNYECHTVKWLSCLSIPMVPAEQGCQWWNCLLSFTPVLPFLVFPLVLTCCKDAIAQPTGILLLLIMRTGG